VYGHTRNESIIGASTGGAPERTMWLTARRHGRSCGHSTRNMKTRKTTMELPPAQGLRRISSNYESRYCYTVPGDTSEHLGSDKPFLYSSSHTNNNTNRGSKLQLYIRHSVANIMRGVGNFRKRTTVRRPKRSPHDEDEIQSHHALVSFISNLVNASLSQVISYTKRKYK